MRSAPEEPPSTAGPPRRALAGRRSRQLRDAFLQAMVRCPKSLRRFVLPLYPNRRRGVSPQNDCYNLRLGRSKDSAEMVSVS